MNSRSRIHATRAICGVLAVLLCSCSGGSGSDVADISGSGVVSGPVSGFGSIIANGTQMDVSDAALTNDGTPVTQADIDIGDSVVMSGTLNGDGTGRASSVITDEFLKGPVTSVDLENNRFVAMGQTVNVDLRTVFDGATLATLAPGQKVEVHGALDGADQIRASRVELKDSLTEYEVTGFIDAVAGDTFEINGLIVNFAGADVDTEEGAPLTTGMYVDVGGSSAPVSGTLTADTVEEEDRVPGATPGKRAEIRGIIGSTGPSSFTLNGITVRYGSNTRFEDGSAANLVVNAEVEVEGTFDSNGDLQAREIEFEQELDIRITGLVESTDANAGTLKVLGKTFRTNVQTQFEDERDHVEPFRLSDVQPGDYVEVRGYRDGADLIAARVERDDLDEETGLRGPVESLTPTTSLTILGVIVNTDVNTQYRDRDDSSMTASAFFAAISVGSVVEVGQDDYAGTGPIIADELEIE